jgi:hypothetical protein
MSDDLAAEIDGGDELFLVYAAQHGIAGLRELLDMFEADGVLDRGYLQRRAAELRARGVGDVAGIVTEYARRAPRSPPTFKERLAARLRKQRRLSPLSPRAISSSARAARKPPVS